LTPSRRFTNIQRFRLRGCATAASAPDHRPPTVEQTLDIVESRLHHVRRAVRGGCAGRGTSGSWSFDDGRSVCALDQPLPRPTLTTRLRSSPVARAGIEDRACNQHVLSLPAKTLRINPRPVPGDMDSFVHAAADLEQQSESGSCCKPS